MFVLYLRVFCCIKHWLEIVGRSNQRNKSTMLAADGISLLHGDDHDHDGGEGKLRRKFLSSNLQRLFCDS